MTDNIEHSKQRKRRFASQSSKRSKLTLSLKSDSTVRSSGNCETRQLRTGSLQEDLRPLSTEHTIESSTQNLNTGTSACSTETNALCAADINDEVISIKSNHVKLDDVPHAGHLNNTTSPCVDDIERTCKTLSDKDLRQCCENDTDEHSPVKKLFNRDNSDLNCSLQATCHKITMSIPSDGISKAEESNSGHEEAGCKETIGVLEVGESGSARKVEAWLCNQDTNVGDGSPLAEDLEQVGKSVDGTEQRITSEFFREDCLQQHGLEVDDVLQCPLCWKWLDKKVTSHLKLCAARHKISTQQLLEALELQRRQAHERRALGLPVNTVKKQPTSRKGLSGGDASLQLALALSMSLQEAEEREQDALRESDVSEPMSLSPGMLQQQLSLLEKYGFTCSRPALPTSKLKSGVLKTKLKSYPLLSRTKEERERLITEKVAIVLMGEEDVEQALPDKKSDEWYGVSAVSSDLLLRLQDRGNQLWEMAQDISADLNKDLYYVESLASQISPCKVEPGAKLKHVSQIKGRINTPKGLRDCQKMKHSASPGTSSNVKSSKPHSQDVKDRLKNVKKLLDFSPAVQDSLCAMRSSAKNHWQSADHFNSLVTDWASVLNKQAMSDITIHVRNNKEIPAHKLVFFARCPELLFDLVKEELNGNVRELLMWIDVSYETALAFLEYIYCGTMKRILHLKNDIFGLKILAQKYQVTEIIQHMQVMHDVGAHVFNSGGYDSNVSTNSTAAREDLGSSERSSQKTKLLANASNGNVLQRKINSDLQSPGFETKIADNSLTVQKTISVCNDRCISWCSSPDIFNDECTPEEWASQESRASVDCLLSLMNKEINVSKTDSINVICCNSQSNGSVDNTKKNSDISGTTSNKIVSKNMCIETNASINEKNLYTPDTQKSNYATRFLKVNTKQSLTMDLTQDSSDEDSTQQNIPVKEKCVRNIMCSNSTTAGKEFTCTDHEELSSYTIAGSCSCSKQVDRNVVETEQEIAQDANRGPILEPTCCLVDNVWDDFDDLEVVPNLLFYSTPTRNGSSTSRSGHKFSSPSTRQSLSSSLSQGSVNKCYKKVGMQCEARSIKVNEVMSPSVHCGEVTHGNGATLEAVCVSSEKADYNYKNLLEDSLVDGWNRSDLWRGECDEPLRTVGRVDGAVTPHELAKVVADRVSPLPDYSAMKTPLLKKELSRYGLKPLKRNYAKQILRHIYNEMHPLVDTEDYRERSFSAHPVGSQSARSLFKEPGPHTVVPRSPDKRLSASSSPMKLHCVDATNQLSDSDSEDLSQTSISSSMSNDSCAAEELNLEMETLSQADPASETGCVNFQQAVRQYIKSTPELYEKILQYEPVWLEELQAELKAQKLKFNINQLMDFLDEQCITFRTAQGQQNRARRKECKRKSISSLSQPLHSRPKKKPCTQPS